MVKTAIQTFEENSKNDLLSIHENIRGLIERSELIQIELDDTESYNNAVNLKRVIKETHVKIEKRRKELKAPLLDAGKRLDEFAKSIYDPLKQAEESLKFKMIPYETEQERIKEEKRLAKEQEEAEKEKLNAKLMELNSTLQSINLCKTKKDVEQIENTLNAIDLKQYGERSDEAGFIISNLKMTCSMFKKSLPDDVQEVLIKNESGLFEEISLPIKEEEPNVVQEEIKNNTEIPVENLEFNFEQVAEVKEEMTQVFDAPKREILGGVQTEIMLTNKSFSVVFNLNKGEEFPSTISITNFATETTKMFNLK